MGGGNSGVGVTVGPGVAVGKGVFVGTAEAVGVDVPIVTGKVAVAAAGLTGVDGWVGPGYASPGWVGSG